MGYSSAAEGRQSQCGAVQGRTGQHKAGQVSQGRIGQYKAGQVSTRQDRSEQGKATEPVGRSRALLLFMKDAMSKDE